MRAERICDLNDAFRRSFAGGRVMTTAGVAAMSEELRAEVFERVRTFEVFTPENDPHGEHDFGSFEVAGRKFFWKIDAYDAHTMRAMQAAMKNTKDRSTLRPMMQKMRDERGRFMKKTLTTSQYKIYKAEEEKRAAERKARGSMRGGPGGPGAGKASPTI